MFGPNDPEIALAVLNGMQTGVYLVDRERRILFWNDGAERITGYHRHEVIGRRCADDLLVHCDTEGALLCGDKCPLAATMHDGNRRQAELFVRHRNGHRLPVYVRSQPIRNDRGEIIGAAEIFDVQTVLHRVEQRCEPADERCSLDERTGVPDHEFTVAYLRAKLKRAAGQGIAFGVLRIELQNLDRIMAMRGRDAAQALLVPLAATLKNTLRVSDYIGAWGEYQFLVVMNSLCGTSPVEMAQRLRRIAATSSIQWWGDKLTPAIDAEATTSHPGDTVETLLARVRASQREIESALTTE
jgi:PAS domain S-box-containing protein/diguanylate cyclase (GGDEF)-like protein